MVLNEETLAFHFGETDLFNGGHTITVTSTIIVISVITGVIFEQC